MRTRALRSERGFLARLRAEAAARSRPRVERAAGVAARVGATSHADWAAMLESQPLDGVFVCTPPGAHAGPAIAALRGGLAVYLEKPLAHGGMGSVWRARHVDLDVLVAVKFMDEAVASTEAGRARFEREAKSAAQLHSPHVVQILDHGVHEGIPYIAMELLEG